MHNKIYILKRLSRHSQPTKPTSGQVTDGDFNTPGPLSGLGAGAGLSIYNGDTGNEARKNVLLADSNVTDSAGSFAARATSQLGIGAIGLAGNPVLSSIGSGILNSQQSAKPTEIYSLTSYKLLKSYANDSFGQRVSKYRDFRWLSGFRKGRPRLDGTSATLNIGTEDNINPRTIAYAAANLVPGGVYSLINRETLYGWGDQGSPSALRNDFSARTQVSTRWIGEKWKQDPVGIAFPFRGDKINVVDYGKRTLKNVYKWKPDPIIDLGIVSDLLNEFDQTQDFIKFYFTGPKLAPEKKDTDESDDIMVFRATINSFSDSFTGGWESKQMIGRADPSYLYTSYNRSITFSFDINPTSRDEVKPIWRKLNALASYTAPEYVKDNIAMKGPWMRFTMGDLFTQTPIIITSLTYTLVDGDTNWEINIEDDITMMQVPQKISVTVAAYVITDVLPQKNGRMYSLAKRYESGGISKQGSDNWLSDFSSTVAGISGTDESNGVSNEPAGSNESN